MKKSWTLLGAFCGHRDTACGSVLLVCLGKHPRDLACRGSFPRPRVESELSLGLGLSLGSRDPVRAASLGSW